MYTTVMVPLDGYPLAESALPLATRLCARSNARLHLVHALDLLLRPHFIDPTADQDFSREGARHSAELYMRRIAERIGRENGIAVSFAVVAAPAIAALKSEALRSEADLIVMMTHGRGPLGRLWMGSVADAFARSTPCPVVFIRPSQCADLAKPVRRIVVGLDGSAAAEEIVSAAGELAVLEQAELTLLHVTRPHALDSAPECLIENEDVVLASRNYLTEVALRELPAGVDWRVDVVVSDAPVAAEIICYTEDRHADLVAVGVHQHGRIHRVLMGSTSDKVLRGADVPVLLYRPALRAPVLAEEAV